MASSLEDKYLQNIRKASLLEAQKVEVGQGQDGVTQNPEPRGFLSSEVAPLAASQTKRGSQG